MGIIKMMGERELKEMVLSENRYTLESIYQKYKPFLFLYSFKILKDMDEAMDSVQEAFLKALINIKRLRKGDSLKKWLLSIAKRVAIERRRRISIFNRKISELVKFKNNNNRLNIEISELLEELNPREKSVIFLHSEGLKSKEIGEIIGCSESTARVHLFNARKKLKRLLKGK